MVVVIVDGVTTTSAAIATSTSSSHSMSSASSSSIPGIVVGTILGCFLLVTLVVYFFKRHSRRKFDKVANPSRLSAANADNHYVPTSQRARLYTHHSQKLSTSSDPLISPASWPPHPTNSRVLSPDTLPCLDHLSPTSSFHLDEIDQGVPSLPIPAHGSPQPCLDDTPPTTPSMPQIPQQTLFIHRMLKSRALVTKGLVHQASLAFSQSRSMSADSSDDPVDEERLLAEAERTALRDAEIVERREAGVVDEVWEDWDDMETVESVYSQASAPVDHSGSFASSGRRPSRRQFHTVAPLSELVPVVEVPESPRVSPGQAISRSVSTVLNFSLEAGVSHETVLFPMASVEQSEPTLPLLTSGKFKTSGSVSSTVGSSFRASRYPSVTVSSTACQWSHPPPGLAGLLPPDSPMERAHLRQGSMSSVPEVERMEVRQGGIASIDFTL